VRTGVEAPLRRIFSNWHLDERAWVVAPLAIWFVAFLIHAVWQMTRQKRVLNRRQVVHSLGRFWSLTFLAAVLWLVGWSIGLTLTGVDTGFHNENPQNSIDSKNRL
jgi:hypothetical protein